jgi:hypothetical protein
MRILRDEGLPNNVSIDLQGIFHCWEDRVALAMDICDSFLKDCRIIAWVIPCTDASLEPECISLRSEKKENSRVYVGCRVSRAMRRIIIDWGKEWVGMARESRQENLAPRVADSRDELFLKNQNNHDFFLPPPSDITTCRVNFRLAT